jgi:hypothetical protein
MPRQGTKLSGGLCHKDLVWVTASVKDAANGLNNPDSLRLKLIKTNKR